MAIVELKTYGYVRQYVDDGRAGRFWPANWPL